MTIKKHFKKYNVTIDSNLPNYGLSIDVKKVNELRDRFSVEIDNLLHEKAWDFTWLLALEMSGVDTSKVHWENIEPFLTRQKWRELMVLFDKDDGDDSGYDDLHYCSKILETLEYYAETNVLKEVA